MSSGLSEDIHTPLGCFPFHLAILEGEKRVVVADAHVVARMEARTALADQNGTCQYGLSIVALDAQSLAVAVASVLTGSLTFFVCHDVAP